MEGKGCQPGEPPSVRVEMDLAVVLLRQCAISISAQRRKPWVVVTEGWAIACQIPGARLMVQTAIATVRIVKIPANGSDRNTSQAYQRSTTGAVIGNVSAISRGTELPRSVPASTRMARMAISAIAARTEQKNLQTRSTTISGSARDFTTDCCAEACVIRVRAVHGVIAHSS